MHDPQKRCGQGQEARPAHWQAWVGVRGAAHRHERSSHNPKQREPGEDMNGEVERMITPDGRPADRIVDGQGEIQQRPAVDCRAGCARRRQDGADRPQMPDCRIAQDGRPVVEDERAGKAVMKRGEDNHARGRVDRPTLPWVLKDVRRPNGLG